MCFVFDSFLNLQKEQNASQLESAAHSAVSSFRKALINQECMQQRRAFPSTEEPDAASRLPNNILHHTLPTGIIASLFLCFTKRKMPCQLQSFAFFMLFVALHTYTHLAFLLDVWS